MAATALKTLGIESAAANMHAAGSEATCSLLTFEVAGQSYALRVDCVSEIVFMATLSCRPATASVFAGLLNLRGQAVPVIDMARLFELGGFECDLHTPIILIGDEGESHGLLVERVLGVCVVPQADFVHLPDGAVARAAIRLNERIVPVISIRILLLKEERARIGELRQVEQRRLAALQQVGGTCP